MVKDGRMMAGKPMRGLHLQRLFHAWAMAERAEPRPIRVIACLNFSRSSALSMASLVAPIISTPYFSSTPCLARSSAQLSAVWPPMVGSSASGRSLSMMFSITCQVMGSM